jgi:hypothetical protein
MDAHRYASHHAKRDLSMQTLLSKSCLFVVAALALANAANAQLARPAVPMVTETSSSSDTIGERAAWSLEQQRLKNNPPPAAASPIGVIPMAAQNAQRAGSAPDFACTGIRGFVDALEGSFLINGKRAAGSARYPTLVDGWKVAEITSAGAVIERGRERKHLPFSGSSPYQDKPPTPATAAPASPFYSPMGAIGGGQPPMVTPPGFGAPGGTGAIPLTPGTAVPAIR